MKQRSHTETTDGTTYLTHWNPDTVPSTIPKEYQERNPVHGTLGPCVPFRLTGLRRPDLSGTPLWCIPVSLYDPSPSWGTNRSGSTIVEGSRPWSVLTPRKTTEVRSETRRVDYGSSRLYVRRMSRNTFTVEVLGLFERHPNSVVQNTSKPWVVVC